jgi:hypothetical protein
MTDTTPKKDAFDEIPSEALELHPLVFVLSKELTKGEGAEMLAPMSEDKFVELGAAVLTYVDDADPKVELLQVVESLGAFALVARDQCGSERLANQLFEIIGNDDVVNNLQKLSVSADPEKIQKIAERFGEFAGAKADKKAPKVGEAKPEGSIDINALNFPKRM